MTVVKPADNRRSGQWPAVREAHLRAHPTCAACGRRDELNVHHVQPFHIFPSLELEPGNLVTLCEGDTVSCHLAFGHLMHWRSWNPAVRGDAALFLEKVKARPVTLDDLMQMPESL